MTRSGALGGLAVVLLLLLPGMARAATITVTGTDDEISNNGVCSLREAVIAADTDTASQSCPAGSGADTIVLPAGRYRLFLPGTEDTGSTFGSLPAIKDLDVTGGELTIQGAGAGASIIDANEVDRAIDAYKPLTVADLSIVNGRPQDTGAYTYNAGDGGAIRASAPLTIARCVLADNRAAVGLNGSSQTGKTGDPYTFGEFARAGADGGAVYAESSLTVIDSRFESNAAGTGGTGGAATGGEAASTGPQSQGTGGNALGGAGGKGGSGGAIWVQGGLNLSGSTFEGSGAGNGGTGGSATGGRSGIYEDSGGVLRGGNGGAALSGNGGAGGSGGAVFVAAGAVNISNSYFVGNGAGTGGAAGNASGGPIYATIGSQGGDGTGGTGGGGGSGGAVATAAGGGVLALSNATLNGDVAGAGGTGGLAKGGDAATTEGGGTGPGQSTGGTGGVGGVGGGGAFGSGARLINVTVHANRSGNGGNGGAAIHPAEFPLFRAQGGNGGAGGAGGGVANTVANTQTELRSSTLTANGAGGGGAAGVGHSNGTAGGAGSGQTLAIVAGRISLGASIVVGPSGVQDCSGAIEDHGGNLNRDALAGDSSCTGTAGDAGLGELTDNGGPVPTQRPNPLGPAIDRAPSADCPSTDARLVPRPFGGGCDIGAYEVAAPIANTGGAQAINASGGTLTAAVNPHAAGGVVYFEYGTTTSYGSQTQGQALAPRAASEIVVGAPVSGFTLGTVVHFRVLITTPDGSAVGSDRTFITARSSAELAAEAAAKDRTPPRLTGVSIGAKRFAVSGKPTPIAGRRLLRAPLGTTFKLTLSEPATTTFAFARKTVVKRHGHKRVRYRAVGALKRALKAGPHKITFSGRIGRKALKPGPYRVQITAVDAAGNRSTTTTLKFTIVRG